MTETDAQKVERLAARAVEKATRRGFTITKFGRHEDGYLHARVTPSHGKPIYVHRRYGAWMAPGTIGGRAVEKEVLKEIALELQTKARALEKAERGGNNGDQPADEPDAPAGSETDV